MRVFVYEYLSARADGPSLPASLAREGAAMLFAVLRDFTKIAGLRIDTIANAETSPSLRASGAASHVTVHPALADEEKSFRALAAAADYSLIIAPESNGILADRCRWVESAGGRLLGPSASAVELTADKFRLARHLQKHRVSTPACELLDSAGSAPARVAFPAVLKPRDGAGSQATFFVQSKGEVQRARATAHEEGFVGEFVLQPFVSGRAISVALLLGPAQQVALPPATQELSDDGRFHYHGGQVPLRGEEAHSARELALAAVRTVPGLSGYVGVDLVWGSACRDRDSVIEINPRLTTSYIGLRALARTNLMAALLDVAAGKKIAPPQWREGTVHFRADGRVD